MSGAAQEPPVRAGWGPRALFWTPTLIWASTWHVILYQLAQTTALQSVFWRFALAAVLMAGVARWHGHALRLPWRWHGALWLTGSLQYGLNYLCVYEAERHIPSGLVAVLFSLMVFINAFTGAWLFGRRLTARFVWGALAGVLGVALIFWPELQAARAGADAGLGLGLGLLAVVSACTGNVLTLKLTERGLPLMSVLTWCMGYGAITLAVAALMQGEGLRLGTGWAWWGSLLYLTVLGTVLAFLAYFKLAQQQGPGRAALTSVLIPVLALLISTALEGWRAQALSLLGVLLSVGSVWWASRPEPGDDPGRKNEISG